MKAKDAPFDMIGYVCLKLPTNCLQNKPEQSPPAQEKYLYCFETLIS